MIEQAGQDKSGWGSDAIRPRLDGEGRFACDIHCAGCGYNLRGSGGEVLACPECGEAVSHALARYRKFWFSEEWLRGVLLGRASILGALALMPSLLVLEVLIEVNRWRGGVTYGLEIAVLALLFVVMGMGACWISAPVKWGSGMTPRGRRHQAVIAVGWLMMMVSAVWFVVMIAGQERGKAVSIWLAIGLGALVMVGEGVAQSGIVWGMMSQCRELGRGKAVWWLKGAYLPLSLWQGGLLGIGTWCVLHWKLQDHQGLVLSILGLAGVIGAIPGFIAAFLMNHAAMLVDEAIHMRMGGRVAGSVPEGVELGAAFWEWVQKNVAKRHERRRLKMVMRGKRIDI